MEIKLIDNPVKLAEFLINPANTGNIVDSGDKYYIKPDAVYDPGFRGEYALQGHRLFCKWLLENSPFLNSITMVPDTTKYGRAIIRLLGATRVGHLDDAYMSNGKPVGITLYQLPRSKYEELLNVST
ncbi:DUF2824 family protein [Escherichia coli]